MNEQSTINAMMLWLYRQGDAMIDGLEFAKLPRIDRAAEDQRRSTFSRHEINAVASKLEEYVAQARKDLREQGSLTKLVVSYYLLIAIITGLRTGEQRQWRWGDIRWNQHRDRQGNKYDLVEILVRAESRKVRKSREFYVQDKEYFEDLRSVLWPLYPKKPYAEYLVFSADGKTPVTPRSILYYFHKALDDCEIKSRESRDFVPYSFRHYFITDKIKAGLTYGRVADMCGISSIQIENTYRHIDRETRLTAALADYDIDAAGRILPKRPTKWDSLHCQRCWVCAGADCGLMGSMCGNTAGRCATGCDAAARASPAALTGGALGLGAGRLFAALLRLLGLGPRLSRALA
jgi:integrase